MRTRIGRVSLLTLRFSFAFSRGFPPLEKLQKGAEERGAQQEPSSQGKKMGDSVFGFVGDGYSIIIADMSQARSVIVFKQDEDKIWELEENKLLGCSGPQADRTAFGEYIQKNLALYRLRTGLRQSCHATANYIRTELAEALRRAPYQVNVLMAGYDSPPKDEEGGEGKPSLYWMDYLGSLQQANFGAQGYASYFLYSLFDAHWEVSVKTRCRL